MSSTAHHVIIVTSWSWEQIDRAYDKAWATFPPDQISSIVRSPEVNLTYTIFIGPDGSKDDWPEDAQGNEQRQLFIEWLRSHEDPEDGSSPFKWVEVAYGDVRSNVARSFDTRP